MPMLNDVRTLTIADGASLDRCGIYTWTIEGVGVYVGKFTSSTRPLREYNNNVRKLLSGEPYRKSKPTAFRAIHVALAKAVQDGTTIELRIVANCEPTDLATLERQMIAELATGGLNRTN